MTDPPSTAPDQPPDRWWLWALIAAFAGGVLAALFIFYPEWRWTWVIATMIVVFGVVMFFHPRGRYLRKSSVLISIGTASAGFPSVNAALEIVDLGEASLVLENLPYFGIVCIIAAVGFAVLDHKSRDTQPSPPQSPVRAERVEFDYSTRRVILVLDGEFGAFGDAERRMLQSGLAGSLGVEPSAVRIVHAEAGSIRVTVEIPADSVPLLLEAFRRGTLADYVKPLVITDLSERQQTTKQRPETPGWPRRRAGTGATAIAGNLVIEKAETVIIGSPGAAPIPEHAEGRQEPPHVPGAPKVSTGHLPITGPYLFGRDAMLEDLDGAWDDEKTNVFALVAGGGVGKSALVNHWLAAMAQDDFRGARRVYGHSFYSQGTSDGTASAEPFFDKALAWFGDPDPTKGSAWARGERLAELVRTERTLLILDGMEPLQFPPGPNAGRITDPGLQALIRELAARNPGLCVVTTREHVADLDRFAGAGAAQKNLEDLPNEAGVELLKELGVKGPMAEMKKASEELGNHALALTLLGTYLVKACNGDIRRRTEISLVAADKMHGGHARKVMASYEKWFTEHGREAELAIVRMLGLFNRPAEAGCVAALRGGEAIADLTAGLADISEGDWNIALANLREAGLLAKEDANVPGTLDAHPLVREHFAERLEKDYPEAWKAGHERLYEHLKGPGCKTDLPDTAEEMAPLYAAVLHGCAAGRHQKAFDEVFIPRIRREREHFSVNKLGLWGSDLGALGGLFVEPWRRPVAALSEADQGFVLNEAGMGLRALGRLTEAVDPVRAGLEQQTARGDWENAARAAGSISELQLTLGRIPEAIDTARQSVDFADRSGDAFQRMGKRTTLADALHQAGRAADAQGLFQEAERMQKDRQRQYPLLYSLQGYQYCDLLLGQGDHQGVIDRATQTLKWSTEQRFLLDIALDQLSLGRAHLLAARAEGTSAYKKAWAHIDLAVDGLRNAGEQEFIARSLLARAALYLFTGDHAEARAALNEAMDIATRDPAGPMKLFVTDCHLGYARLALAKKKTDVARDELANARALIKETGYHRRDEELTKLEGGALGPRDPGA